MKRHIFPKVGDYVKLRDSCMVYSKVISIVNKEKKFTVIAFMCDNDLGTTDIHCRVTCKSHFESEGVTFDEEGLFKKARIEKIMTKEEILDEIMVDKL